MRRRLLLLFYILLLSTTASLASHIVGGEFELLHISGNTYRLNLILYFDVANGNAGAADNVVIPRIYQKSDNQAMFDVTLNLQSRTRVEYFNPDPICTAGGVVTDKLIYTNTVTLPDETFNDQEGYYVAWERCCRNYSITNAISNNPQTGGLHAGQTYYLEFPAVVDENGDPFINSTPQLFPPLSDYGCPGWDYWIDFAGSDIDGDSLVYSLTEPLSTFNAVAIPQNGPGPAPYPKITWRSGYGMDNIMNGNPRLTVDSTGFLRVTPTEEGLYVFAVKCQEFRDGKKIGEVIRDFQMFVLDRCPVAVAPEIKYRLNDGDPFVGGGETSVSFPNTIADADRCVTIQISDLDSEREVEPISLKVVALNFNPSDDDLNVVLPDISTTTLVGAGDTEEFEICFPECPFTDPYAGEPAAFKIGIVAFDNACTLPLSDTLKLTVDIEPPLNRAPVILSNGNDVPALTRTEAQGAGKNLSIPIQGRDDDGHDIAMTIANINDFELALPGMSFTYTPTGAFEAGPINTTFNWNLDCNDTDLDFSEGVTVSPKEAEIVKQYNIKILLEDKDDCNFAREDKLEMELNVLFPNEYAPNVYQVGQSPTFDSLGYRFELYDQINLNIRAKDGETDTDNINLTAVGANFNLEDYGISFQNKFNQSGEVTTPFSWSLDCDKFNLAELDSFRVYFITEDIDACNLANKDTLSIDFLISAGASSKPNLFLSDPDNMVVTDIRKEINVTVFGTDADEDSLFLSLLGVTGARDVSNFEFKPTKGYQSVSSGLTWTPDCEHLDRLDPGEYRFTFLLLDDHCPEIASDTISLDITVNDIVRNQVEFIPPNVFTPNDDTKNEYFGMYSEINGEVVSILPVDNCEGVFEDVQIYNRWGREVFSSTDRDFKWFAKGEPTGVYFYQVNFSHRTYKGTVSVLY